MTEPLGPPDEDNAPEAEQTPRRRKPYVKPSFEREQLFETMALACGKINTTIAQCRAVRKNS